MKLIFILLYILVFNNVSGYAKNEIMVHGWVVKAPIGWQIAFQSLDQKQNDTGVIETAPHLNDFHSGKIKQGIYFYYEPRDWPHLNLHDALNELKTKRENSDVKLVTINSRDWLINRTKIQKGDLLFARVLMKPKKYIYVRGENLNSEKELINFLEGISFPK